MLTLDCNILSQVVSKALADAADHPRWINAIRRAFEEVDSNPYMERTDHGLLIGSPSGKVYAANGTQILSPFDTDVMAEMAALPYAELVQAIVLEDIAKLKAISGVGPKTAQRVVMELKDKFKDAPLDLQIVRKSMSKETELDYDVIQALLTLGYSDLQQISKSHLA